MLGDAKGGELPDRSTANEQPQSERPFGIDAAQLAADQRRRAKSGPSVHVRDLMPKGTKRTF